MNNEQSVLLKLIKQSQFGLSEPINLSGIDMSILYNEALSQAVLGLVASEIPTNYLTKKWNQFIYKQKSLCIRYCYIENELKIILDKAEIPFVIIKGNASAINYNDPTRRSMGDIDFLVPPELYEKTKDVIKSSGYSLGRDNGRHTEFKIEKQYFEVHHHFSHEIDIEKYLLEGINNREFALIEGYEFPMLPKLANGLVILDHLRNHLKRGLGLRHIVDWMMYVHCNLDDVFWYDSFQPVVKEYGMEMLACVVTRMCQLYLGLPNTITWCKCADDNLCNDLLECTLLGGNFGQRNGKGGSIESAKANMNRVGMFHWLQSAGENNWNAYHRHHWLKHFCWIYQSFRYLRQAFDSGRNFEKIRADLYRGKVRAELLKKLNIK